jgi:hypothetical protein
MGVHFCKAALILNPENIKPAEAHKHNIKRRDLLTYSTAPKYDITRKKYAYVGLITLKVP